jgi:VIT1/CCC1 family predicted Fe2+/Mn2+ transporter
MQWRRFATHYIRDIVYAANDGIVTTFAVVAGVRGANLSPLAVLALGFANLAADGLSMAVGNYLGIKSERATELGEDYDDWQETVHAARHGSVTWAAFIVAGLIPLAPFFVRGSIGPEFELSLTLTVSGLFAIGATRTLITRQPWWRSGLEMLAVGSLAGGAAFAAGWAVSKALGARA